MRTTLSRRMFLAVTGGALVAPTISLAASEVPELLDHLILGCNDLDRGIAFVEARTGVRAAIGGVHPGRGTRNALLSLGERRYLEIIAPDPQQSGAALVQEDRDLRNLTEPKLVGWAVHPPDIASIANQLRENKIAFQGPDNGSRKRPDGRVLNWKTVHLADDCHGLLPFFIEWSADSLHPSVDAPAGCRLIRFEAVTPEPDKLAKTAALLSLDMPIIRGAKPQLRTTLAGPKGDLSAVS